MRFLVSLLLLVQFSVMGYAQNQASNSLFDDYEGKTLEPKAVMVEGEVEAPGRVELSSLPVRSVAIKEMALENGKEVFKGAYFVSGYSLYDILSSRTMKKSPKNPFAPPVDLYAIVENEKGEKAVFSWGEIYYKNSFDILITKSIQPIYPARVKVTYALPDAPRLICGSDMFNVRYLSNPTKITVRSFHGAVPKEKPSDIFAPEVKVVAPGTTFTIGDVGASVEKRTYSDVGYGHGMGFKGKENVTGYVLKDLLTSGFTPTPDALRGWIVVASAKDGYRVVLSLSEILNRSDNEDILLLDRKDSPKAGRFVLYPADDFFADRDVRAVEKLELLSAW